MTGGIEAEIAKAIPVLLGTVIGFLLANGQRWFERKRRLKAHWQAIRAEMTLCNEKAETFINSQIMAPLYRFPIVAVETAFPILLAEGALNEDETLAVSRYSAHVGDLNRGLDFVASHTADEDDTVLDREYGRVFHKTKDLVQGQGGNKSLLEAAKSVVDAKLLSWRDFV